MGRRLVKQAGILIIVKHGDAVERWVGRKLVAEQRPVRRATLSKGLQVVRRARADPERFMDNLEDDYDLLVDLYHEWRKAN